MKLLPKTRRLRFTLRFLFALTAVLAVLLAFAVNRAHRQRDIVRQLRSNGVAVYYAYQPSFGDGRDFGPPDWLSRTIGGDFFFDVRTVNVPSSTSPNLSTHQVLEHLRSLSDLESLCLYDKRFVDDDLGVLIGNSSIEQLFLGASFTDGAATLLQQLVHLKHLDLGYTQLSKEKVQDLRKVLPDCLIVGR